MKLKVTEPPTCSHCGVKMVAQELPPINFSDGLGWGTSFLWVCPSDDCPIFRKGFYKTMENYGQTTSMRAIVEPDSGLESVTPAFTLDKEHLKDFVKIRKEYLESVHEEDLPLGDDDDDEWPDDDIYDPSKD